MTVHRLNLKNAKSRMFGVSLDVFKTDVGVFFDRKDFKKFIRKNFGIRLSDEDFSATADAEAGAVFNDEGVPYFYILFNQENPNIGVVAHESVHVSVAICEFLGIPINHDCDEILAYMVDYLVQSIVDEVRLSAVFGV